MRAITIVASLGLLIALAGCAEDATEPEIAPVPEAASATEAHSWRDEVIYHVMPRSFRDSNGDRHGDLNGFVEQLDYLEALGVTAILFTPLYESDFYHNYFPSDYEAIDPEYGTMDDYVAFVKAVHARGMKFIMDMETQYAPEGHKWLDDSLGNPASEYSDFIAYADDESRLPEQFLIASGEPPTPYSVWPDKKLAIAHLDLNHPTVIQWMSDFFVYFVDPNGDGNFDDGVDGFRIDHIMDDLDHRGQFTNLYRGLWRPIFERSRAINPAIFVVGEQADWGSTGAEMVSESNADASFHFALHGAVGGNEGKYALFDTDKIEAAVTTSLDYAPGSPYVVNFIENHDTTRFATLAEGRDGPMRAAAVLNLFLPGVPAIYYGQEVGMTGRKMKDAGDSDGVDIPKREAFPWSSDVDDEGMAAWYIDSGPWWDQSLYHSSDVERMTVDVQRADPGSLWNHYRELIATRKNSTALRRGDFERVETGDDQVFAFRRTAGDDSVQVIINLSGEPKAALGQELGPWAYALIE